MELEDNRLLEVDDSFEKNTLQQILTTIIK